MIREDEKLGRVVNIVLWLEGYVGRENIFFLIR